MTKILKNHSLPVQIEGFPYILAGLILTISSAWIWKFETLNQTLGKLSFLPIVLTLLFFTFTLFSIWFYRNPDRNTPQDEPKTVFSPADGRVLKVETVNGSRIGEDKAIKVSIFMSPMDVHVNRAPISGVIEKIQYNRGKFFKADLDKASEENENNWVVMKSANGVRVGFVQIAGFVARRIVCYVTPGETLSPGERYGMIRFGSRMEIVMPLNSEVLVKVGERTVAGETRLAKLK